MNRINEYNFSELYEIASGISTTKEQAGHGSPFVSFSTIFNNYFLPEELPDLMDTSDIEQETYSVKEGDILLTRTSETIDELAMSCIALKNYPCATFSGFAKRLRPKTQRIVYHKYLGFYLRGYLFRQAVTNHSIMTLRSSFNEEIFALLKLYLPKYEQQKLIGDLLYSIEQKIQLNNAINAEMEKMAKILYDYWFVQFDFPNTEGKPYHASGGKMVYNEELKRDIPKEWKVVNLGNVANMYQPKTINAKLLSDKYKYFVYGSNGVIGKYYEYNHDESVIAVSCRGDCGNVYRTLPQSWITGNAMVVKPLLKYLGCQFLINLLKNAKLYHIATGSVQKQITQTNLSTVKILLPPQEIIDKYNNICDKIYNYNLLSEKENIEFTALRDFLLPLLMNGQVTVAVENKY